MKTLLSALFAMITLMIAMPTFANEEGMTASTVDENVILYVDINSDGVEKLADLLNGIGEKKAEAIIAYRTENGPFETADDLLNVPGIGTATLEKNRAVILLGTEGA